jgi:hypothetical protein
MAAIVHLLDRSRNKTKVKTNVIIIFILAGMRFSRFVSKSFRSVFQLKTFIPGEFEQKKKRIYQIMSFLSSVMIESALKIIIFAVCPNFPIFLCNCPELFFPENFSKTKTNKTKKELRISIVRILSYGLEL